jgi:hypothetical protein
MSSAVSSRWRDLRTQRDVVVVGAETTHDWPPVAPWQSSKFGLLLLAEHVVDAGELVQRALDQGLVFASVWGPGCEIVEETFDEVIVEGAGATETAETTVLTTSHADESLEETLEFFLEAARPAPAHVEACATWVVFPVGLQCRTRVERALEKRGARRDG